MNVGIYANGKKDVGYRLTKKLCAILCESGFKVYIHRDTAAGGINAECFDESSEKLFDTMLTVGGDGTILRIAAYCARHDIAVLGVNLGNVGFLTEIELSAVETIPSLLKDGSLIKEYRSLLSVNIEGRSFYALNEIVLSRHSVERMIAVAVSIGGRLVDKYYCDGYIVSTPSGSTAYCLSAGGCVISPKAKAFCLLPINSHSLHSRPVVVDDEDKVTLKILDSSEDCVVIADGRPIGDMRAGAEILIEKADRQLVFLRLKSSNFYEKLLTKLNTWSVTIK